MVIAGICKFIGVALGFAGPIFLNYLIKFVADPTSAPFSNDDFGWVACAILFGTSIVGAVLLHQHHHVSETRWIGV
jgi:hypothetical protein